ncbi:MAG: CDP-alcohol phosphatidyltransferase family protein [Deltaproteobacteria bacterium]|nr:CDP-alcohol phosphatidyltransferase family protein [Deltaproteobacteria bacterium]
MSSDHLSGEDRKFQCESHSKFDPFFMDKVCTPLLRLIPKSVHPNTISIITHLISWATLFLAYYAWRLGPVWRSVFIVGVAFGLVGTITGDYLDGMQARRTNQSSKLGEMMDHWLDTIGAPLNTAAIALAMQMPAWVLAPMHISNVMIYNAQLVLYHHAGVFVHPKASGSGGLFQTSISLIALAFLYRIYGRDNFWVELLIIGLGVVGVVLMATNLAFFYIRLKQLVVRHVYFAVFCLGFAALYTWGAIDTLAFLLAITFLSFRINGAYVMSTIINRRFNGYDSAVVLWLLAIYLAYLFGVPRTLAGYHAPTVLTYLACAYIVLYNGIDFTRRFSEFAPQDEIKPRVTRPRSEPELAAQTDPLVVSEIEKQYARRRRLESEYGSDGNAV